MILAAYVAGIVTPFLLYALVCAVIWAVGGKPGVQCMVCEHLDVPMGRRYRVTVRLLKLRHDLVWRRRRWHRARAIAYRAKWDRS